MRVMAQVAMVMALDKCIGCHTCSVTCKQAWTNRAGTEYVWFNNVETRPGQGYPRRYEDQEKWKGGWVLNKRGRLELKSGNRFQKLFSIFASPIQPELTDYYEPWTYDYQNLTTAPLGDDFPAAKPVSLITGKDTKIQWGLNWDDNLGGAPEHGHLDPLVEKVRKKAEDKIKFEFEQTFMFYLPRICEHGLNPSCMAACPSGAIYKRAEDGIVLVDRTVAAVGVSASPAAPTRRCTSTTRPVRPRSAHSATPVLRLVSPPYAPRPAWVVCVTSVSSSTMQTG